MNTVADPIPTVATKSLGQQKNQIQLIASYLMQALHIPDGDHLVRFFGTGHENSNGEALVHWIETHLDEINLDDAEKRLKHLANNIAKGREVHTCNE